MQSSSNQDLRVCLFRVSVVPREILPRPHFISKCRTLYRESKLFLCFIVLTLDSDDTRYSGRRDRELLETQHIRTRFVCYTAKERIVQESGNTQVQVSRFLSKRWKSKLSSPRRGTVVINPYCYFIVSHHDAR